MPSISSLTKAVSGLNAAQKGLQVTGHNIVNTNTKGYTRQQLLQSDSGYLTIGYSGTKAMQVGTGVNCDEIRQIRDQLADRRLRSESSILNYYQKLSSITRDVTAIFDEPYGSTVSNFIDDFWAQAQKLSQDPTGVTTREGFISSAKVLMSKINLVSDSLEEYQMKLDQDVRKSVDRINQICEEIKECNDKISIEKATGENANDYRDKRNLLLDELAQYGDVSYFEESDRRVSVSFEGHNVINKSIVVKMKLEQTKPGSPFKSPVWGDTGSAVFDLSKASNSIEENDTGSLKAILVARGNNIVDEHTTWDDIALNKNFSVDQEGNAYVIPKIRKMLNEFTTELVTLVNDHFVGTGTGAFHGVDGVPVFTKINEGGGFVAGNVQVNPLLLENGGFNRLGVIKKGAPDSADKVGDNTIVMDFLTAMKENKTWYHGATPSAPLEKKSNLKDFFSEGVTDLGEQGSLFNYRAETKNKSVNSIENERQAIGGVSTDEEFSSMLKYQYAYNASSRLITMIDSMLDTIINRM